MSANPIDKDKLIAELQQDVKTPKVHIYELMERLAKYENPKNSSNSSLLPVMILHVHSEQKPCENPAENSQEDNQVMKVQHK